MVLDLFFYKILKPESEEFRQNSEIPCPTKGGTAGIGILINHKTLKMVCGVERIGVTAFRP
jgi:hypothetical protein